MRNTSYKLAPGLNSYLSLGSLLELQRKGYLQFFYDIWQQFGDVARCQMGWKNFILLAHPKYIQHVLVDHHQRYSKGQGYKKLELLLGKGLLTSEGKLWQAQRRRMQPFFTEGKIKHQYIKAITASTEQMLNQWQPSVKAESPVEIGEQMLGLTMSIVGRTLLGTSRLDEDRDLGTALRFALDYAAQKGMAVVDWPTFIPTPSNLAFKQAMRVLERFIDRLVEQRSGGGDVQDDLLAALLSVSTAGSGQSIDRKQLRDELLTMFLAGSETTASTLTWLWYLLAIHPEVEQRLLSEVDDVLSGRTPTEADLPRLEYTKCVIEEVMRLYPPAWAIARDAVEDDEISGYCIPKDSMVFSSAYLVHRHPEFWVEPSKFNPDRFASPQSMERPRCAYIPFGCGPRTCIGLHLALVEAQLVVATVMSRYRLKLVSPSPVEPFIKSILRPRTGVMMRLVPRCIS